MSLFTKFRRKNKPDQLPQVLDSDTPVAVSTVSTNEPPPAPVESPINSPTSPEPQVSFPVQSNSIFSGLHLTSKVTRKDTSDSGPNVKSDGVDEVEKSLEQEEEGSPFAFLETTATNLDDDDGSPADARETSVSGGLGDGFSFLGQPTVLSEHIQDTEQENTSHEQELTVDTSHTQELATQPVEDKEVRVQPEIKTSQKTVSSRLTPASGEKKKKKKAIRPGQSNKDGMLSVDSEKNTKVSEVEHSTTTSGLEHDTGTTPLTSTMATAEGTPLTSTMATAEGTPLASTMATAEGTPLTSTMATAEGTPLTSTMATAEGTPLTSTMATAEGTPLTSTMATAEGTPLTSTMATAEGTPLTSTMATAEGTPLTSTEGTPLTSTMATAETSVVELDVSTTESDSLTTGPKVQSTSADTITSDDSVNVNKGSSSPKIAPGNYQIQFSHEESLSGLLQSYASGLAKLRNEFNDVENTRRDEILEQVGLAKQQVDKWLLNHSLREKEATALAEEDYELAEQLSKQLELTGVEPEQEIVHNSLSKINQWIQSCNGQKENEVAFQKEMKERLRKLREDHNVTLEDLKKEHTSILAKEKMQLQSLVSRMERESGHIELDCSHLEKREQLLKEETSARAVDFISKKEELGKELNDTEAEIDALETKLSLLRAKKKEIMSSIATQEGHIRSVEEELSEERAALKEERAALQERQEQLSSQQKVVQERQQVVEDMGRRQEGEQQSLEDLMNQSTSVWGEVKDAITLHEQSSLQVRQLLDLIDEGGKLLKPSHQLIEAQRTVETKKKLVDEQTSQILTGQNELGELRRKVQDTQSQLTRVLESKKAAVTGRQFKEASRLAGESKTIGLLLEQQQAQLNEAEQTMSTSSKELAQLSEELSTVREQFAKLERTEDENHIESLLQASSSLSSLSEVFGEHYLRTVVETWNQLYLVLLESLRSKHSLDASVMAGHSSCAGSAEPEVDITTEQNTELLEEQNALLVELENEIAKACQEENYDRAAELEEQLQSIKMKIN